MKSPVHRNDEPDLAEQRMRTLPYTQEGRPGMNSAVAVGSRCALLICGQQFAAAFRRHFSARLCEAAIRVMTFGGSNSQRP
jgi:hypothetical protein